MITSKDLEIDDETAKKMNLLYQMLRSGYLKWKETGRLPNGQSWNPPCDQVTPDD